MLIVPGQEPVEVWKLSFSLVTGALADGSLRIEIADDGKGGASMSAGTGIRGLIDRVRGVGGDLILESPAGRGTRIEVKIPCG